MTLIEVLVALMIFSVGLLGAAAVQLKALKYTDSALMSTQASFIAYAMLDRIRANSGADYAQAPLDSGLRAPVHHQDVHDFQQSVLDFGGPSATGHIRQDRGMYTLAITWDDSRAAGAAGVRRSVVLSSRAGVDSVAAR